VKIRRDDWDDDERRALKGLENELEQLRARHQSDPPFELLRAADAEALPESLQEPLSEHLKQSAWSRALVEGAGDAESALDATVEERILARVVRPARETSRSRWTWRAWAPVLAAAAVLVVMVGVLPRNEPAPVSEPPRSSAETPVTTAPPAPRFMLPLDQPDVKLTPQALVLRSDAGGGFAADIAPALKAYNAHDYVEADKHLAALHARYPNAIEVAFYRGITQLFLNEPGRASESLQTARRLDDGAFAADITWYLAIAYERAGDTSRARAELDSLCRQTSAYSSRACDAGSKLTPE
jgi:hypothetical protein